MSDGDLIREAREDLGMKQSELCQRIGRNYKTWGPALSEIEHNKREVPRLLRTAFERELGITLPRRPRRGQK